MPWKSSSACTTFRRGGAIELVRMKRKDFDAATTLVQVYDLVRVATAMASCRLGAYRSPMNSCDSRMGIQRPFGESTSGGRSANLVMTASGSTWNGDTGSASPQMPKMKPTMMLIQVAIGRKSFPLSKTTEMYYS